MRSRVHRIATLAAGDGRFHGDLTVTRGGEPPGGAVLTFSAP